MINMSRGRDKFDAFYGFISLIVVLLAVLPRPIRMWMFVFFRNWTGYLGLVMRYIIFKTLAKGCGRNVGIHPGVYLLNVEGIVVGDNVSIHPMCYVDGSGGVVVGSDVSIAHSVTIMSSEHNYSDCSVLINNQGVRLLNVVIESNVWIGAGVKILAGSKVGSGCVVAAGAVVKSRLVNDGVYAGVPARLIKSRC